MIIKNYIFQKIEPFAEYGFNKSHAAAYAVIAYQTAYLKAYYPKIKYLLQIYNTYLNDHKI